MFPQYASKELSVLSQAMADLETLQTDLAEFFCEDPATFKIEECFRSLGNFSHKFKQVTAAAAAAVL